MMDDQARYNLLFGRPIEFDTNVNIKVPTVEEAVKEENLQLYTMIFTLTTRELFQTLRNVDELEKRYPSLWSIMMDDEADMQIGSFFDSNKSVSMIFMEALHYWTGLPLDGEGGFRKLMNGGRFAHIESEWVIDYDTFREFGNVIKSIIHHVPNDELPPPITSDSRYSAWMNIYNGRRSKREKAAIGWAERIQILSISTEAYIPIHEIEKMSLYHFYGLFDLLGRKEAYETKLAYQLSPKFESSKNGPIHWRETIRKQ